MWEGVHCKRSCVIVLFGSLPLDERVPVWISGINEVLSLKLHFGQNMQAARHLKPASGKAYSKAFYRNIQNRPSRGLKQEARENSSFLNDNPSKGNMLQSQAQIIHVSWETRSGFYNPRLEVLDLCFLWKQDKLLCAVYFLKQAILGSCIIWLDLWLLELGPFKTFFTSSPNFSPRLLFAKANLAHWSDCTCRTTFRPLKKRQI